MPTREVQTTHSQHAVPQNVLDVEFKIIGDLTMRQFFYIAIFCGAAYFTYLSVGGFVKWLIVVFLVFAGLAFAFLPIDDRGLDQWIVNFFKAIYSSNQRVWKKMPQNILAFDYNSMDVIKQEMITLAPTSSRRRLEKFLDSQTETDVVDPLDIKEAQYIKMVKQAYKKKHIEESNLETQNNIAVAVEDSTQNASEALPKQEPVKTPQFNSSIATSLNNKTNNDKNAKTPAPQLSLERVKTLSGDLKQNQQAIAISHENKPQPKPVINTKQMQKISTKKPLGDDELLQPITPDKLSGRRFNNLLPEQGEIILPVRGEKIINTSAEQKVEQDIEEKARQLEELLKQIKKTENLPIEKLTKASNIPEISDLSHDRLKELQEENKKLSQSIEKLQKELKNTNTTNADTQIEQLQKEKAKNLTHYVNIKGAMEQVQRLNLLKETASKKPQDTSEEIYLLKADGEKVIEGVEPKFINDGVIPTKSNILAGVVKNDQGQPLTDIVIIIKNSRDEPVRALKTDSLGKFAISTPVVNDIYTIESDKSKKTNYTFDIIKVEVKGDIIPPIEIVGKVN